MSFPPISSEISGWKPANIAQIVGAELLPFVLAGCLSRKLAVAAVKPMPFLALECGVRAGEFDRMAVTLEDQPPIVISSSSSIMVAMRPTGTVNISKKPALPGAKVLNSGESWKVNEWYIRFELTLTQRPAG